MSPHCVWIITAGGAVDLKIYVTNPNIVMLTELGQCIMMMYGPKSINVVYTHILQYCN